MSGFEEATKRDEQQDEGIWGQIQRKGNTNIIAWNMGIVYFLKQFYETKSDWLCIGSFSRRGTWKVH